MGQGQESNTVMFRPQLLRLCQSMRRLMPVTPGCCQYHQQHEERHCAALPYLSHPRSIIQPPSRPPRLITQEAEHRMADGAYVACASSCAQYCDIFHPDDKALGIMTPA